VNVGRSDKLRFIATNSVWILQHVLKFDMEFEFEKVDLELYSTAELI